MSYYLEIDPMNPSRPPDWRYQRVQALMAAVGPYFPSPCSRLDDEPIKALRRFRLLMRTEKSRNRNLIPNRPLHYMCELVANRNDPTCENLLLGFELRILAGQSNEEIAKLHKVHRDVVRWYADIHFDVRPHLGAWGWIDVHVLQPAAAKIAGMRSVPMTALLQAYGPRLAYFGGPDVANEVLRAGLRARDPNDGQDVDKWLDASFRRVLRLFALVGLLNVDVSQKSSMALCRMHTTILRLEQAARRRRRAGANAPDPMASIDATLEQLAPLIEELRSKKTPAKKSAGAASSSAARPPSRRAVRPPSRRAARPSAGPGARPPTER